MFAAAIPDDRVHDVTVVLADDPYLKLTGDSLLTYQQHATILSRILNFRPKAVFVDMTFRPSSDQSQIRPLIWKLRQYRALDIPVYVAANEATRDGIDPQLAGLVQLVSTRTAADYLEHQHYELWRASSHTFQSPALALLDEYCDGGLETRDRLVCEGIEQKLNGPTRVEPMLLRWATEPARANVRAFECNPNVGDSLFGKTANVIAGSWREQRQFCPRHPTLLIDNLLAGFTDEALQSYLRDQIVIYGAEFEDANNWVSPATHAPLSSAFVHATAFENLLLYGDGYYVRDRYLWGISIAEMTKYGAFIFVILVQWIYWPTTKAFIRVHDRKLSYRLQVALVSLISFAAFLIAVALLQFLVFRIDPFNVIGMLAFFALLRQVAISNILDITVSFLRMTNT